MDTAQKFTLGSLVSPQNTTFPDEVSVSIMGRGIFCRLSMEFSFANDEPAMARLFTVDRPWNAVLVGVSLNGERAEKLASPGEKQSLPAGLKSGVQEAFQDGKPDIVSCFIEAGCSLRSITLEFVMSCDVLWHKSALNFVSQANRVEVTFDVNWDLTGLPGAKLECLEAAAEGRFSSLDGARQQWHEKLTLLRQSEAGIMLALDEKKAASICLYSRLPGEQHGCGAVVVVAPVRPQLVRKPVRIAVVVEVRNPQDSLATRDLVDHLSSTLNPTDQISIFLVGFSVTRKLLDWKQAAEVQEDDLAQLLDPALMGRAQYFWEGFQRVLDDCQDATHVLLSSPGPAEPSPDDLVCRLPVFTLAVGRKPSVVPLEDLATRTGGFLSEQGVDGVDSFLQRLVIRLSPPLLKDFKLEGWGLEKEYPPGVTQVYTDKPTLVLGLYDGLLPQTVTLGGLSPAGQKLAQRVRVEDFNDFSLLPLFEERSRPRSAESSSVKAQWSSEKFMLLEATRPVPLDEAFLVEEDPSQEDGVGPPAIDMVGTAVDSFDMGTDLFPTSAGETLIGDPFSAGADSSSTIGDDFFSSGAPSFENDGDLFSQEPLFEEDQVVDFSASTESVVPEQVDPPSSDTMGWDVQKTAAGPEEPPDQGAELSFGSDETIGGDLFVTSSSDDDFGLGDDLFDQPDPAGAVHSSEATITQAPANMGDNRSTVSVDFHIPDWVKKLSGLENRQMREWLSSCPIDELALALVDTDRSLADTFLSKLEGPRKAAVELQMEWGRLLPQEERQTAGEALDRLLS